MKRRYLLSVICIYITCGFAVTNCITTIPGEDFVKSRGYPFERHKVTTEDGYILETYRIPYGRNSSSSERTPVFIMHGLGASAECWFFTEPSKSLALRLVEEGYDVWIGNARGTTATSRRHVRYNADWDRAYWKFSWHEIGMYDLPANIDYILKATGQNKLVYIGHSQGTTSFFVMASERPEYNNKITMMTALAPATYLANIKCPICLAGVQILPYLEMLLSFIGLYELLPPFIGNFAHNLLPRLCQSNVTEGFCKAVFMLLDGEDNEQIDMNELAFFARVQPASASVHQVIHYAQSITSGKFSRYDKGHFLNMARYKRLTPPEYPLEKVTAPVAVYYSKNDYFAVMQDVEKMSSRLSNVVLQRLLPMEKFNHFDFIWAKDVNEILYNDVINFVNKYRK